MGVIQIQSGKTYVTRGGMTVKVIETSLPGPQPIAGFLRVGAIDRVGQWFVGGKWDAARESALDLIDEQSAAGAKAQRLYAHITLTGDLKFKSYEDLRMKRAPWLDQPVNGEAQ